MLDLLAMLAVTALILYLMVKRGRKKPGEERKRLAAALEEQGEDLRSAFLEYKAILHKNQYVSRGEYRAWAEKWGHLQPLIRRHHEPGAKGDTSRLRVLHRAFTRGMLDVEMKNRRFTRAQLRRYREYFDHLLPYPLSLNQRKTVITDEKYNLVIAGPGTGKTATIIAKAGYLIQEGVVRPQELLLLAYARKARDQLRYRAKKTLGRDLDVHTFHSLGRKIISEAEGKPPSVSVLSTDQARLNKVITEILKERAEDPGFRVKLNHFFTYHKAPIKSQFNFKSMDEYRGYLQSHELRSLKGDLVKSREELQIANTLYLNNVMYVYEADYLDGAAAEAIGQYRPDFYLPGHRIYIEHFGLNREGKTAPWVDEEKYLAGVEWKRKIHRETGTTLIETYSYLASEGSLPQYLMEQLALHGVKPANRCWDPLQRLRRLGLTHPLSGLLGVFLNLYKAGNFMIHDLYEAAKEYPDTPRLHAFLEVFHEVYQGYGERLGDRIDFNDMINRATAYVITGRYCPPYKYVLVDEFQDISHNRYLLLRALLDAHPDGQAFCVGDDWQSIYRFTGSDPTIMAWFHRHLKPCKVLTLEKTFRLDDRLCAVSSRFIRGNPAQVPKTLTSSRAVVKPSVSLIWTRDPGEAVRSVLEEVEGLGGGRVQVLGRYRHQRPDLAGLRETFPALWINYSTIHGFKGREADYVVLLGLTTEGFSFPSRIEDDPVLDLVLPERDGVPLPEERRLFYVALTRARRHVYLVADSYNPSSFALELVLRDYDIRVYGAGPGDSYDAPQ